jgi:hypothetical protein
MLSLIIDLSILLVVLCLTGLSLAGWGRLCGQLMLLNILQTPLTMLVWLGFAVVLVLAEAIHLLFPIDWHISTALGVVGIIGMPKGRLLSSYRTLRIFVRQHLFVFVLAAGWIVLCCMRAMGVPNNFDSGLYHFQSIRWLNEEALAVGLGNLHWRLALNQSYFGFLALLNVFPLWGHGYAAGGLFLVLLTYATILDFVRTERMVVRLFVGAVLFTTISYYAGTLANPSPDTAVALIQIPICLWLIRLTQIDIKLESNISSSFVTAILLLSVALVTIKLSSLVFAGTAVLVGAVVYFKDWKANKQQLYRVGLYVVVAMAVYVFRGYLLSGYPLFPSTILGMESLPWALPTAQLQYETKLIYSWAREPGSLDPEAVLHNWAWLSSWVHRLPASVWLPLLLGVVLSGANAYLPRQVGLVKKTIFYCYVPIVAAVVFWFMTAPDPRFLGAIPGLFFAISLYVLLRDVMPEENMTRLERLGGLRMLSIGFVVVTLFMNVKLIGLRSLSFSGWLPISPSVIQEHRTDHGAVIYTGAKESQCWNAQLPCAAAFNPRLQLDAINSIPFLTIKGLTRKVFLIKQ